eukprot:TRINITY_DN104860_c0_g1_i1.p1 TRINITY_DN104860_c0_g1~~TRINITY_DN104860_c0_g1_i1.p1  ORF type:complete len:158 (+),score=18.22 TRINITY_DN104860_c0_g1_i1:90-563(+)
MSRISRRVRSNFCSAVANADVKVSLRDREIDELCRHLRKQLAGTETKSLADESKLAFAGLRPFRDAVTEGAHVAGLDSDQWCNPLWNLWRVCTETTEAEDKLPLLWDSPAAWADLIAVLLAEPQRETLVGPWWIRRWIVCCTLLVTGLSLLCLSTSG